MAKLLITPVAGSGTAPFIVSGKMTVKEWVGDGKVYYINGDSFPEEIVTVLYDKT